MTARAADLAWLVLTAFMALNALGAVVAAVVDTAAGEWFEAGLALLSLPVAYWVGMGAWRRTRWGRPPALGP